MKELFSILPEQYDISAAINKNGYVNISNKSDDDSEWFPLSAYQLRIWNADQLLNDASYNIPITWKISGALNINALSFAWYELQKKHEALRLRIEKRGVNVMQKIISSSKRGGLSPLYFREIDEFDLSSIVKNQVNELFNLIEKPPIRGCLLRLNDHEHYLIVILHHVVSDGWTVGLLAKNISSYYSFALHEKNPLLLTNTAYLTKFVEQENYLSANRLDSENFWKTHLTGSNNNLELPYDYSANRDSTSSGDSVSFIIPQEIGQSLRDFSIHNHCTVFSILVSVLQILLFRLSGQHDIRIGYPVARRTGSLRARIAGCLINTLVLPISLDENYTLDQLVRKNQEWLQQASNHEDTLLEQMHDIVQSSGLFEVLFNFNKFDEPTLELEGLHIQTLARRSTNSPYPITWIVSGKGTSFQGRIEYQKDKFNRTSIEYLLDNWLTLIKSSLSLSNQSIKTLNWIHPEQVKKIFSLSDVLEENIPIFVHQAFEMHVQKTPDAIAVSCNNDKLTYQELSSIASRLALKLIEIGVQDESPVAVCVSRGVNLPACLLAVFMAMGMYLPLDPLWPDAHIKRIISDARVQYVIVDSAQASRFTDYNAILVEDFICNELVHIIKPIKKSANLASAAYCIYTSGSTGMPKGVIVSHLALAHHINAVSMTYAIKETDKILQFASAAFDTSLEQVLIALINGIELVIRDHTIWTIDELLRQIQENNVTIADIPTSYWYLLSKKSFDIPKLRLLIVGGEAVVASEVPKVPKLLQILNAYGPTEATITSTLGDLDDTLGCRGPYISIGCPIQGTGIRILDDQLQMVPIGVPGEIFIFGNRLARGYLNKPNLTAERFLPDPFGSPGTRMYRSGDMGRWLSHGRIEFLGRNDHQVKVRGVRIELGEIEAILLRDQRIQNAAAVIQHENNTCIYVFISPQLQDKDLNDIKSFVRVELPETLQPTQWIMLENLPLNVQGKIDRSVLKSIIKTTSNNKESISSRVENINCSDTLKCLLTILQELSPTVINETKIDTPLHDLGIHSVLLIQLIERCKDTFNVSLKIREILKAGTILRIAELIDFIIKKEEK
ncbi:amino acid adenylation domain-containing protein [Acinetobacter sp. ACIN00229]|uniref:non-ribosomal peptide synthetase n=1 Tax=Acinetobacter sp. ACIN00229 TaxID=2792607 RepID=UPI0018E0094B|nr:non-ribosomal peptide synthetase [Acinetobacter sp. ACIN00229]MBI0421295.1 amino acid adenylation domain-containing protein [Acinetobacter sp. ACIN00229]